MTLILYTDGACSGNPGKGGWGCIAIDNDKEYTLSGYDDNTTNNRMELNAVIEGLKKFPNYNKYIIYSDSKYVINFCTGIWKKLKTNHDLWLILRDLVKGKNICWLWVKGHSGDKYNDIADKLAKGEIIKNKKSFYR